MNCKKLKWIGVLAFLLFVMTGCSKSVYVCNGPYAKSYHKTPGCWGLDNCSASVVEVSVNEAKDRGRTACEVCKP